MKTLYRPKPMRTPHPGFRPRACRPARKNQAGESGSGRLPSEPGCCPGQGSPGGAPSSSPTPHRKRPTLPQSPDETQPRQYPKSPNQNQQRQPARPPPPPTPPRRQPSQPPTPPTDQQPRTEGPSSKQRQHRERDGCSYRQAPWPEETRPRAAPRTAAGASGVVRVRECPDLDTCLPGWVLLWHREGPSSREAELGRYTENGKVPDLTPTTAHYRSPNTQPLVQHRRRCRHFDLAAPQPCSDRCIGRQEAQLGSCRWAVGRLEAQFHTAVGKSAGSDPPDHGAVRFHVAADAPAVGARVAR